MFANNFRYRKNGFLKTRFYFYQCKGINAFGKGFKRYFEEIKLEIRINSEGRWMKIYYSLINRFFIVLEMIDDIYTLKKTFVYFNRYKLSSNNFASNERL